MSRASSLPESAEIEYLTHFDSLGRCRFAINWIDLNGKNRSQVFFANPKQYGF